MKKMIAAAILLAATALPVQASDDIAALSDTQFAHAAYTADNIDIRYAHLALAISTTPEVREFARTMIADHEAVNAAALELLDKMGAQAEDNFLSQKLNADAEGIIDKLSQLRGAEFDRAYAENELAYHQAVNGLVEGVMIPNIDHPEVKALFEQGLEIFKVHETHAEMMVKAVQ